MSVPPFRVATPEERASYEQAVYPLQDRILAVAATYGNALVLTGCTALARLYLHHRYSDDLDLFSLQGHVGTLGRDFANTLDAAGFVVEPMTEETAFMRMWVGDGTHRIQVDVAPDSRRVEPPSRSALGVYAHAVRDIAANEIGAFEDLLWHTPRELRTINERTRGVLERRASQLPLPQRIVLLEALAA